MDAILLGVLLLVSPTDRIVAPQWPDRAVAPVIFSFELPESAARDWPGSLSGAPGSQQPRGLGRSLQATRPRHSRVDRIIAVAAGVSLGWVIGGAIGYAVTPKRGPYDDTSGLKGVMIGAPIGGAFGALIGYRLTK